ncbi:hypothetical protein CDD80_5070 [Ophiocordyceps camponoti-rufipedis]|uniref:Uncharacterized protein n=1 Tax=Ophiocordyceps camponoti-rufipedis TaxID=2004952 RepID=A0A2C5YXM3_9HYPO|nr:hypothetical protein CDD80_5070 [Ophiocordyceps camponoti-rufipedis]
MKKAAAIPDAWDDNWETQADDAPTSAQQHQRPALTKAERLTQHAEANRKLWESADAPQTFHYLEASSNVPLTSAFKPQVKVLSRKPAAKPPVTGMARLAVHADSGQCLDDDDDDDDGKDGDKTSSPLSAEQIRAKQKRDREEKQRRYDEARAKIFGQSAPSSRGSSPGTVTPPRPADGRHNHHHPHHHAATSGRGRGRGGAQRPNNADTRQQQLDLRRQNNQTRELYDPNYSASSSTSRLDVAPTRRAPDGEITRGPPPKNELLQPIRAPRGPDSSGRGGFGFARRGSKEG